MEGNNDWKPRPLETAKAEVNNEFDITLGRPAVPNGEGKAGFFVHKVEWPSDLWGHLDFQVAEFLGGGEARQVRSVTSLNRVAEGVGLTFALTPHSLWSLLDRVGPVPKTRPRPSPDSFGPSALSRAGIRCSR